MNRKLGWWFSVLIASACARALGQETLHDNSLGDLFVRGKYELNLSSGVMFSPIGADHARPTLNYTLSGLELGWMLTDVNRSGWLAGNVELAGEVIGGAAFYGPGNYLAGGTAWARYNFVQPGWRVIPYIQGGAGLEAIDMDSELIGGHFAFNLNIGAGARYLVDNNWSINVECLYQHLSNATIHQHDVGINAVGPMLSVSYFF
ncbi:MAG TPA: acyloxyacyl hydrolase [Verrucomicrobiae bacterium]|nr:acyloxyacyl hydrolase [Verrucomicrobiae bacterium]